MLAEIYKTEDNVNLSGLTCKETFETFIRHEANLLTFLYIIISLHLIYGVYLGVMGILNGMRIDKNMLLYVCTFLLGIWNITFNSFGLNALCKQNKSQINCYSIGILLNLIFEIVLFIAMLVLYSDYHKAMVADITIIVIDLILQGIIFFCTCVFRKMYKSKLKTYMVV